MAFNNVKILIVSYSDHNTKKAAGKHMKKFLNEFKEFAMRGNVLDMAVGIIVGAAFTAIVTSLVDDILSA